jgi:hypothetical protein
MLGKAHESLTLARTLTQAGGVVHQIERSSAVLLRALVLCGCGQTPPALSSHSSFCADIIAGVKLDWVFANGP